MTANLPLLSGGQLVVASLRAHGVEMAFGVAGESYLEVLDALYDAPEIRLITCRQEGGAAFMAEAYGKLTGEPGVLLVTRGPGACNASIGVHTAFQDSTPMIVLVGQVARSQIDREAFQEVDFRKMYAPLAKWVTQIDLAERVPELINQAFQVATSGRPGPVVLALPEDMLRDRCAAAVTGRYRAVRAHPGAADLAELRRLLAACERPMVLVGGSGWSDAACADIARFAEANDLPVCCSFRRQDIVDNRLPSFVGDLGTGAAPALVARFKAADLVLAVGARIGEITSQSYTLMGVPDPGKTLIHVHAAAEELGRVFRPDLAIQSGMPEFAAAVALEPALPKDGAAPRWRAWREAARSEYEAGLVPSPFEKAPALDLGQVMTWLRERLPDDAIVTSDAGNFSGWPNRFLQYRRPGRQLGPTSGAMGYGVPAAVAASLVHPDRLVVGFCGDGGFMMTGQELMTALGEGVGPIILLFNNGMYGTIRMHQERRFPGRVVGTALKNPDFAALAAAYGAFGATVARTEEFAPAFEKAVAARRAAIIELQMDPEMITTRTTLSAIRRQAAQQQQPHAPDFAFQIGHGAQETLKQQRDRFVVLLVLFSDAGSAPRLRELDAAAAQFERAGVRIIPLPMEKDGETSDKPEPMPVLPHLAIAETDHATIAAYSLFRRTASVEGVPPMPAHMEFLIDRQGYLRNRWSPDYGAGWGRMAELVKRIDLLNHEPLRPPAPEGHVH